MRDSRDRATVLPEVFTYGEGDIDSAHANDGEVVAGNEIAELVEHSIVGQVVLGVTGYRSPAVKYRRRVDRGASRYPQPIGHRLEVVEVADHDGNAAETLVSQPSSQRIEGLTRGSLK